MSKKTFSQLTLENRREIEEGVERGDSASAIARLLEVSPSTVTREVEKNRVARGYTPTPAKGAVSLCARYDSCTRTGDLCRPCTRRKGEGRCRACRSGKCFERCPDFLAGPRCPRILSWPHTCDRCPSGGTCGLPKIFYRAERAQKASDSRRSSARRGICCTPGQIAEMDAVVTPLLKRGQSPAAIWAGHPGEFPVSARTFYRYMEQGLTDAVALDLPEKVRRRPKPKRKGKEGAGRDRVDRTGRTYEDFLALTPEERMSAWQIDTVVGHPHETQRIFTLELPRISYQPYILLPSGRSECVVRALDGIEIQLGSPEEFRRAIPFLLPDRGAEFDDWEGMERSCLVEGRRRCRVFYTDPQRSDQKASCERSHRELRRIFPKGRTRFDALTAWDVALACSHASSYPRPALGGARPIDLAALVLPEALTAGLGIEAVPPDEVMMRPELVPNAMDR